MAFAFLVVVTVGGLFGSSSSGIACSLGRITCGFSSIASSLCGIASSFACGSSGIASSGASSFTSGLCSIASSFACILSRFACFSGSFASLCTGFFGRRACFLAANEGERTHQGSQSRQKEELVGLHSLFSSLLCLFRRGRRERRP